MSTEKELMERSGAKCELCGAGENLGVYEVQGAKNVADKNILICATCRGQIDNHATTDANHWRCLNESVWSEVPAVKVIAWRMLHRLQSHSWAHDLSEMLYLDEATLAWANSGMEESDEEDTVKHIDSNGSLLQTGDTVVLIKDLDVKGGGFTAKRGTSVRGISLVADNPEHIEGRVNGQQIVLLTKYVKKAG